MRCDWAACDKTAAAREDGWNHCREHLDLHREFTTPKQVGLITTLNASEVADLIARRHAEQYPDSVIAIELGCRAERVSHIRRALGLHAVGGRRRIAECGTRSGYGRHKAQHEPVCADCDAVEREYQAIRHSRNRATRRAA